MVASAVEAISERDESHALCGGLASPCAQSRRRLGINVGPRALDKQTLPFCAALGGRLERVERLLKVV